MRDKLNRAEAYYLVARELEQKGHELLRAAAMCNDIADRISAENVPAEPQPVKRGRKPKADPSDDLGQEWPAPTEHELKQGIRSGSLASTSAAEPI